MKYQFGATMGALVPSIMTTAKTTALANDLEVMEMMIMASFQPTEDILVANHHHAYVGYPVYALGGDVVSVIQRDGIVVAIIFTNPNIDVY